MTKFLGRSWNRPGKIRTRSYRAGPGLERARSAHHLRGRFEVLRFVSIGDLNGRSGVHDRRHHRGSAPFSGGTACCSRHACTSTICIRTDDKGARQLHALYDLGRWLLVLAQHQGRRSYPQTTRPAPRPGTIGIDQHTGWARGGPEEEGEQPFWEIQKITSR